MGKIIAVKVKERGSHGLEYNNKVSLHDPSLIAILFYDLAGIGAPIEKACKIFLENQKKFPF